MTQRFPSSVGRKFHEDGRVLPFEGNTIVFHLEQHGPKSILFHSLLDIYRHISLSSFSSCITMLPTSSYHVTLFGGANDKDRKDKVWPSDISFDSPINQCNEILAKKLQAVDFSEFSSPFLFKIDTTINPEKERPITIRLLPLNENENKKLRSFRDKISSVLNIKPDDHDTYRFHITLAYTVKHLTTEQIADYRKQILEWHLKLAELCPVIELGRPEFCFMPDMFAFNRQFYL